jgi:hypothetical protein
VTTPSQDQHTKEEWEREASVFSSRINVLWSAWAEDRRESTEVRTGSSSSDTAGHTNRDRPDVLVRQ